MKKVRFLSPHRVAMDIMHDYECHSPRPFIDRQIVNMTRDVGVAQSLLFTNDPVKRFDTGNCSPYPIANKTCFNGVPKFQDRKLPSSDLDLSLLDCSRQETRHASPKMHPLCRTMERNRIGETNSMNFAPETPHRVLSSIENKPNQNPPNMLVKDNDFFLRRDNLGKLSLSPLQHELNQLSMNKENNPMMRKNEMIKMATKNIVPDKENHLHVASPRIQVSGDCNCHHCAKFNDNGSHNMRYAIYPHSHQSHQQVMSPSCQCSCTAPPQNWSCNCNLKRGQTPACHYNSSEQSPASPKNAVDKKTWALERYEKSKTPESLELEKQNNIFKEKREPTVADLFKIIKLQNEQLILLQEKVDKFISTHNHEVCEKQSSSSPNYVTEQMTVKAVNSEQHKISIGVMTSFEMVRTSTIINKEIVKQSEAQIQCNRSQISIKEVVSKKQNGNFLDGIPPVCKKIENIQMNTDFAQVIPDSNNDNGNYVDNIIEDKTLNELSLYNVQVDNATTPLMSPDQSLYLDVRDYSDSDPGSDDQSNVGWTYYNKVMTHVNGMLQDSDMPSSASALYKNTRQRCLQMQVDKSNISVGKRVTFGDDPFRMQQQPVAIPTDTSLKMNQLAAKYLKNSSTTPRAPSPKTAGDMSFATRKYMEKHKLLQGQQTHNAPLQPDIPRFLDITALKQQPKLI